MAIVPKTAPPPATQVSYAVGKDMIKDGDIISFFSVHDDDWLHKFTTVPILFFCGSRIYHSGVAMTMVTGTGEKRLMLMEAVGKGRRLVNMDHFQDHKFEVHARPDSVDQKKVEEYLLDGIEQPYAFYDLALIGLREFFNLKNVSSGSKTGLVCSETAAKSWEAGGFKFETTQVSPGMLRNVLSAAGVPPTLLINPQDGD